MTKFQPLLGASVTVAQLARLEYPLLVSPKYDGIRAVVTADHGDLLSRKLEPIKNVQLRRAFGTKVLRGCDGELVLGNPAAPDCYHRTQQIVNTADAEAGGVTFWVFDNFGWPAAAFTRRLQLLSLLRAHGVRVVPQFRAHTPADVLKYEQRYAESGWEGVMLRSPTGHYKFGRSTLKEQLLLKLKRFEDAVAEVLGVYERKHNTNEQKRDARGYAKRSSAKAGKRGTGLLGGFRCRDIKSGVEFDCGTGVLKKPQLPLEFWRNAVGTRIKYRFQPAGVKNKPRYPRYIGKP